ncbi:MAG: hypothetical protein IPL50_07705 [Chitinophagaceae bacterium]|nr:hypothetical protein [Chitinophagaceae bacterium]
MTQAYQYLETLVFDFAHQSSGTAAMNLTYTYNMASVFLILGIPEPVVYFIGMMWTFLAANVLPNYLALPITSRAPRIHIILLNFGG